MNPAKILVVEDEPFLRELYAESLTSEGYSVETAADGEEGYAKIAKGGWDLILLDIVLPKINGLEIMRRIREKKSPQPSKRIIFLTNLDRDEELKEALKFGDAYVIKSQITPGDLLQEVKTQLAKE